MLHTPVNGLDQILVTDCMHHGIVTCDPAASLAEVAAMMSAHRVHAIAVQSGDGPSGIVTAADLIAAAQREEECTAAQIAATEVLAVSAACPLRHAMQLMTEHGVTHLLVRDHGNGHPVGVLSTSDVVGVVAVAAGGSTGP